MSIVTHASLVLARFGSRRKAGPINLDGIPGVAFAQVGADSRAAATPPGSDEAYKFVIFGLHDSLESARAMAEQRFSVASWMEEADEVWTGALGPFRHYGEANYLDRTHPGILFESMHAEPASGTPIVVCTSAGFKLDEPGVMDRAREFGAAVTGVRVGMSGVAGLHSHQSFFMHGGLEFDGLTVTFWRDFVSMRDFAYKPGMHLDQLTSHRKSALADRTSFTRFTVEWSEGTWHGTDPLEWS